MRGGPAQRPTYQPWPRIWRMALVAMCTLILCSCRGGGLSGMFLGQPGASPPALPREAFTGATVQYAQGPCPHVALPAGAAASGVPAPYAMAGAPVGPWAPPGIRRPWPDDEYLVDGGDRGLPAEVRSDWEVLGLETEDTIAHFDTLDGRTLVEPSNRVHIYSPRFGSVRKIVSLVQNEQTDRFAGVYQPTGLIRCDEIQQAATSKQNIQSRREIGARLATIYRSKQPDGAVSAAVGIQAFQDAFLPYENLKVIRDGTIEQSESARLAEGVAAAVSWSDTQAVQVILDRQKATAEVGVDRLQSVFTIKQPPGDPRLRIIKVASTQFAQPGDVIDFSIRFDNVGNQPIGNVTIVDNLTPRLEYLPESSQCSLEADFSTEQNEAGSEVLRWEIIDPLPVGQGGVIRFRCRVR